MNNSQAKVIMQALVQGIDPETGNAFPNDAILNRVEIVRAFLTSISALEAVANREQFVSLADIAVSHGRTPRAIESRLVKLGLMTPEERVTTDTRPTYSPRD